MKTTLNSPRSLRSLFALAATLVVVPLTSLLNPAQAKPPAHAPAYGYRAKQRSKNYATYRRTHTQHRTYTTPTRTYRRYPTRTTYRRYPTTTYRRYPTNTYRRYPTRTTYRRPSTSTYQRNSNYSHKYGTTGNRDWSRNQSDRSDRNRDYDRRDTSDRDQNRDRSNGDRSDRNRSDRNRSDRDRSDRKHDRD